jgi:hypothetical protein
MTLFLLEYHHKNSTTLYFTIETGVREVFDIIEKRESLIAAERGVIAYDNFHVHLSLIGLIDYDPTSSGLVMHRTVQDKSPIEKRRNIAKAAFGHDKHVRSNLLRQTVSKSVSKSTLKFFRKESHVEWPTWRQVLVKDA